jgi:hypothetical protein
MQHPNLKFQATVNKFIYIFNYYIALIIQYPLLKEPNNNSFNRNFDFHLFVNERLPLLDRVLAFVNGVVPGAGRRLKRKKFLN